MYINPQSLSSSYRKTINSKRTKGGFIMQYWGEELENLSISGTSGDSGIEGINAIQDVYRSEQLAMQILANQASTSVGPTQRQPLAALAASTVMWYQGQGKRGFFIDFNVDESAQTPGVFTFRLTFVVTEVIGRRSNFVPWHRKPWSTTDTPNIGSGGALVTGGYDNQSRLGVLNSPASHLEVQAVTDSKTKQTTYTRVLVDNALKDSKYQAELIAFAFVPQRQKPKIVPIEPTPAPPAAAPTCTTGGTTDAKASAAQPGARLVPSVPGK